MTTTVLVTGGTGNLGRHVVRRLRDAGAQVRVASRGTPPPDADPDHQWATDLQWATVDYRTRAGLDAALAGVDVVIHCASGSPRGEAESIAALLSSGKRARLPHLIYISIIGVDKIPLGYYRAKLAAERALIASGIPWTILRATQFHDLALTLVRGMCRPPIGLTPQGIGCQPIAVDEVAERLVELAGEPPAGRAAELGGPEIRPYADLARMYLRSVGTRKPVIALPVPGKLARSLRQGHGLTPDHGDGMQTFADFLAVNAPP